jgi:methylthioribose-1-phosphate isomerase
MTLRPLRYGPEGVVLLDQRVLPTREEDVVCTSVEQVAHAIEALVVRGAPAIGCTAALGIALAARESTATGLADLEAELAAAHERLAATRPTAVNLFWALDRMAMRGRTLLERADASPQSVTAGLDREARAIVAEDEATCRAIGEAGASLVPEAARILTHCNAGALATAAYGTALGVVRAAVEARRDRSSKARV